MSKIEYRLIIQSENLRLVETVMQMPSQAADSFWQISIFEHADDPPVDFVSRFLGIIQGRFAKLAEIGVSRLDVNILILCEYEDQCNLTFSPHAQKKIGDAGISLSVSCWRKGDEISFGE